MSVFRLCKVLSLPEVLLTDAMYMVKDGDAVVIYVTDDNGVAYPFKPGLSAYEVALQIGFEGTEAEWIASLQGVDGISAYQVAVNNGFEGTEAEWLASLEYDPGYTPQDAANRETDGTLASNDDAHYPSTKAARTFIASAISGANAYADTAAADALSDAESYADTVAANAEVAAKAYADLILAKAIKLIGGYDASNNQFPSMGGSGAGGAIKEGNLWFVSAPGALAGKPVVIGDSFFAVADNPGQTASNWCVLDTNLGFVPEEAGTAAAAIAAHLLASDPHGDRAYADGVVAALQTAVNAALALRLRFDAAQSLTAEQKTQGQQNLGVDASGTAATLIGMFYDPTRVIQRLTFFHNSDTAGGILPYGVLSGAGLTQANRDVISAISGYKSAVDGVVVRTNSTTVNGQSSLVYGHVGTNGFEKHDPFWSTGDIMQTMIHGSLLDKLPDSSNDFEFRFGFFYNTYISTVDADGFGAAALDPFANAFITKDRAAAYFFVDKNSGYWQCKSGTGGTNTPQTTTTTVLASLNQIVILLVKINADGSVTFYIDGVLVATHNSGKIADGKLLTEAAVTVHRASVATAAKGWFVSAIGYRQIQANIRTGFVFQ